MRGIAPRSRAHDRQRLAMTQWYYSDNERNRHGPLDGAQMIERHGRGELGPDTLVWRDGLPQWQPWRDLAGELIADPGFSAAPDPAQVLSERVDAVVGNAVADAHQRADDAVDSAAPRNPAGTAAPLHDEPQASPAETLPTEPTSANVGDTASFASTSSAKPSDAYIPARAVDEPDSPYAAPRAGVAEDMTVVQGHEVVYAGFWKRLAAYMIDALLVTITYYAINTVLVLGGMVAFGAFNGFSSSSWLTGGADGMFILYTVVTYLLMGAISLSYYAGFESSSMQATLGKLAVGIKVVDAQGRRLSRGRAIGRWFAAMLSYLSLYVGYLLIAFTDRKQGLHDMVAKTQVVDRWAYTARPEMQNRTLGTVALVVLILVGLVWAAVVGVLLVALGFAAFSS